MTLDLMFMMLPAVLVWGSLVYVALRFVRAFERRGGDREQVAALSERLQRIEETLGTLGSDVNRLEESQRFTTRLLSERSPATGPPAT